MHICAIALTTPYINPEPTNQINSQVLQAMCAVCERAMKSKVCMIKPLSP